MRRFDPSLEPLAPDEANHLAGANLDHAVEPTLASKQRE